MTVIISVTNGTEAAVVADSRESSSSGRQSDWVNKVTGFTSKSYHGVVLGTGIANIIEGSMEHMKREEKPETLDSFLNAIGNDFSERIDAQRQIYITIQRKDIAIKAALIDDESERTHFTRAKVHELQGEFEKMKMHMATSFMVASYDTTQNRIRSFVINEAGVQECYFPTIQLGSGADGANAYLMTTMQGIDHKELKLGDMAFFTLSAYGYSTMNQGVGGTPKLVVVSKEGVKAISAEKTLAITNITGAYLAGYSQKLNRDTALRYVMEVIKDDNPKYEKIAGILNLEEETLTGIFIPYASWQERANRRLFGNGKDTQ